MSATLNPKRLLFLDIETVPCVKDFFELDARQRKQWLIKQREDVLKLSGFNGFQIDEVIELVELHGVGVAHSKDLNKIWLGKAALYAEFCIICCAVLGYVDDSGNNHLKRYYTKYTPTEKLNDSELLKTLNSDIDRLKLKLMAHNGNSFDIPVIIRRSLYNSIKPAKQLQIVDVKPWESMLLDSMQIMRFGGMGSNHNVSLDQLAFNFGIASPKDEVDGADVYKYYYMLETPPKGEDVQGFISRYCERDVVTLIDIVQKIYDILK